MNENLNEIRNIEKKVKTYAVEITETLQASVICEADNPEEAEDIIRSRYKDGVYILGTEHFIEVEFSVSESE